jgi:mevalonate kinase
MISRASACGKTILLGEHAVVYGFPAVAVPVQSLRTRAELSGGDSPLRIEAPAVGLDAPMSTLPAGHPLLVCIRLAAEALGVAVPCGRLSITSDIPVASGLGSGAAVSTAIVRVLASAAGRNLPPAEISRIVYAVEKIYHGTPSGVDNTVIAHERPIFFRRGQAEKILTVGAPICLLIADSGVRSPTRVAVAGVRTRREADPDRYDGLFRQIGMLAEEGRGHLEAGRIPLLGKTMDRCHELLQSIEVAVPALDRLVKAARHAGAHGAKLTGAGLGGNIVALVDPAKLGETEAALRSAGAAAVYRTNLEP